MTALGLIFVIVSVATTVYQVSVSGWASNEIHFGMVLLTALGNLGWPLLQAGVLLLGANLIAERIGPAPEEDAS